MMTKISMDNYRRIMNKLADKDFIEVLVNTMNGLVGTEKTIYYEAAQILGIVGDVASYGCDARAASKARDFIIGSISDELYCINVCPFSLICNKYLIKYEQLMCAAIDRRKENKPYDQLVDSMVEYATKAAAANPDKMKAKRFFEFV